MDILDVIAHRDMESLRRMVECDVYFRKNKRPRPDLLGEACRHGFIQGVEYLLECKADVGPFGTNARTPLHLVMFSNNGDDTCATLVRLLCDHGADVHAVTKHERNTPLHILSHYWSCVKTAQELVARGASIHAKNHVGHTPFEISFSNYKTGLMEFFLRLYPPFVYATNAEGWSAIHVVSDTKFVRFCLENGAPVNKTGPHNLTPLHEAVRYYRDMDIIRLLVDYGADVNAVSESGRTPFSFLWDHPPDHANREAVCYLLSKGADPYKDSSDYGFIRNFGPLSRPDLGTLACLQQRYKANVCIQLLVCAKRKKQGKMTLPVDLIRMLHTFLR